MFKQLLGNPAYVNACKNICDPYILYVMQVVVFQADVFSYGLTMYVMLTKQHPFDELEGKGEMDRAIAEV